MSALGPVIATLFAILVTLAPIALFIYWVYTQWQKQKARIQALSDYAAAHNYQFAPDPALPIPNNGSYNNGRYHNYLWGTLPSVGESFFVVDQTETRGSGKSQHTYYRTIACLHVPDTRTQMIINSKINNDDSSGGNLSGYRSGQRYEAEGEFSKFFDIYMPEGTEVEGLAMLAPNTLQYILDNLADYDIEVLNDQIYLYTYRFLQVAEIDTLLTYMTELARLMRLKATDAVPQAAGSGTVARVASDIVQPRRLVKSWHIATAGTIVGIAIFMFQPLLGHLQSSSDAWFIWVVFMLSLLVPFALLFKAQKAAELKRDYEQMKQGEQNGKRLP